MIKVRSSPVLGLAFGGDVTSPVVTCALVDARGKLKGARRFTLGTDLSLDRPDALGIALKSFLKTSELDAAKVAVVGVPARWLISEARDLPPAGAEAQLASLRLAAERITLGDDRSLVFDLAGDLPEQSTSPSAGLIVGLGKDRIDKLEQMCTAADLKLAGITSTSLVVAGSLPKAQGDAGGRTTVLLEGGGAEIVSEAVAPAGSRLRVRQLRHVAQVTAGADSSSLLRALSLSGPGDVLLLEAAADEHELADRCERLSTQLSRSVTCRRPVSALADVPGLANMNGQAEAVLRDQLWPAIVLAEAGRRGDTLPVDFLKPRLAIEETKSVDRRLVYGILGGLVLVIATVALWMAMNDAETEAADLEAKLAEFQEPLKEARADLAHIEFGLTHFTDRAPVLDCLAEVARVMGREEPVWLTNFAMRDDGQVTVQGRASSEQAARSLRDKLSGEPMFREVRSGPIGEVRGGRQGGEWAFSYSFFFDSTAIPTAAPAETTEQSAASEETEQ